MGGEAGDKLHFHWLKGLFEDACRALSSGLDSLCAFIGIKVGPRSYCCFVSECCTSCLAMAFDACTHIFLHVVAECTAMCRATLLPKLVYHLRTVSLADCICQSSSSTF